MSAARITIIGTGTWGTTLAIVLARRGLPTTLWARTEGEAQRLQRDGENQVYLPGVPFPPSLRLLSSLEEALEGCRLLLVVVPAQRVRENARRLRPYLGPNTIIGSAAKGLEVGTAQRMSEVLAEELGPAWAAQICVLSGPSLAQEIAQGLPASIVAASQDEAIAQEVQAHLMMPTLRVYTHTDVVGVELGGALKNIISLGAGIADGLGYGDNAKAAFMTRGLTEITRLGVAMGANPLTFSGLAGLGDLVATCASRLSRNRFVGEQLGRGRTLAEVQAGMVSVAEGVPTTAAARQLAQRYGVEMPITEQMYQVLFAGKPPREAVAELMGRAGKHELEGITLKLPASRPKAQGLVNNSSG